MTETLSCFKAYDIRGELGKELNTDIAYRIGRAYGQALQPKNVVVGGDIRLTSNELKMALAEGLMDCGIDVIDLGMTGTEEIYFATSHLNADGGIQVTASHNPKNYNGMKLVKANSVPISGDSGLFDIKQLAETQVFTPICSKKGQYTQKSILTEYVQHLLSYINLKNIKQLKLVVNAGNGAAGHVIDHIEQQFTELNVPITFIKVNHEPDGNFPNGIPNPLLPENRQDTIDAIKLHGADMGIAWDGDFDRCFFFDEKGQFIDGYYIVGLLAEAFLQKNKAAKIIHDPRLTWNTIDLVEKNQGTAIMCKTGHAFFKERMRLEDAVYGGEMSAHHYFKDFFYCDSGMIPWLLVVELLCVKNIQLSEAVAERIAAYPSSGEINSTIDNPAEAIESIYQQYKALAHNEDHTDGISLSFIENGEHWRFNLRRSNTEPVVRLNVETKGNEKLLKIKTQEILNKLRNV